MLNCCCTIYMYYMYLDEDFRCPLENVLRSSSGNRNADDLEKYPGEIYIWKQKCDYRQ
jgi:hypothetical protein